MNISILILHFKSIILYLPTTTKTDDKKKKEKIRIIIIILMKKPNLTVLMPNEL